MILFRQHGRNAKACLLVATMTTAWLLRPGFEPVFAQNADHREKTTSVEFVGDVTSAPRPWLKRTTQAKTYIHGALCRSDYLDPDKDGTVALSAIWISNSQTKQVVLVSYSRKTVEKSVMTDAEVKQMENAPDELRHLAEHDAELVGEELLNDRKTLAYKMKKFKLADGRDLKDDELVKVWVDPETHDPVQIVIETWLGGTGTLPRFINREVMSNFKWNEPIDPGLFKMDIPAGFKVIAPNPAPAGK